MGRIVPGVTLNLSNAAAKSKYEVQSDASGRFEFVGLPGGDYELTARTPGFVTVKGTLTMSGQEARRNIVLQIGEIEETITVVTNGEPGPPPPDTPRMPVQDTKEDRCSKVAVGGCIRAPILVRHVSPYYPPAAGAAGIEGVVNLEGKIGTDGFMSGLRAVKPANADLVAAAIQAVGQWEYLPTHLDGFAIETHINVTVNFAVRK
jgi:TonB family protein